MNRDDALDRLVRDLVDDVAAVAERADDPDAGAWLRAELARPHADEAVVVVVGEKKRGKSSLVNALVGRRDLLPVDADVASTVRVEVRGGSALVVIVHDVEHPEGVAVDPAELRRHAAVDPATGQPFREGVVAVDVTVPEPWLSASALRLVDTPGVGGLLSGHAEITLTTLDAADALVFVVNGTSELTESELRFLDRATHRVATVLFVLTQADLYHATDQVLERNRRLLAEQAPRWTRAPWFVVSSRYELDAHDAEAAGRPETAARRRARAGFEPLRERLSEIASRVGVLRCSNVATAAATTAGRLAAQHVDTLRALALDPDLPATVEEHKQALKEVAASTAGWKRTLGDRLGAVDDLVRLRLVSQTNRLNTETTRAIDTGDATQLAELGREIATRAEAIWRDVTGELERQVDAMCAEVTQRLRLDLGQVVERWDRTAADGPHLGVPGPGRSTTPTAFEQGATATPLGVSVAVAGSWLLTPAVGIPLGAAVAAAVAWLRRDRDRATSARLDARKYLAEVVEQLRSELPGRVRATLHAARQHVEQAVAAGIAGEEQRLGELVVQHTAALESAEEDLAARRTLVERQVRDLQALHQRAVNAVAVIEATPDPTDEDQDD